MHTFQLVGSCVTACLVSVTTAVVTGAAEHSNLPARSLELSFAANAPQPALRFSVTNQGNRSLNGAFFASDNSIMAMSPSGRALTFRTRPVLQRVVRSEDLKPGETAEWETKLDDIIDDEDAHEPGIYRMYWSFAGARSRTVAISVDKPRGTDRTKGTDPRCTPRGSMQMLFEALDGEWANLSAFNRNPDNPAEELVYKALADRAFQSSALQKACIERFGADAVKSWIPASYDAAIQDLASTTLKFSDSLDECWVQHPTISQHLTLRGGQWFVCADNFMLDGKPHPELLRRNKVLKEFREELHTAGYQSFRDASRALERRLKNLDKSKTNP